MRIKQNELLTAASQILALAVLDLQPAAKIIETYPTDTGYGISFLVDHPFEGTLLRLIDERMRLLIKEDLLIEPVEMMRENAAALFNHLTQDYLADHVLNDPDNIVSLMRIGKYYGYGFIPESIMSATLRISKLLHYSVSLFDKKSTRSPNFVTIEGILCPDTKSLKKFTRSWEELKKSNHLTLGKDLQLYFHPLHALPGNFTWLPKGESLKNSLISWWKEQHREMGYSFITTSKWSTQPLHSPPDSFVSTLELEGFQYLSDPAEGLKEIFELIYPNKDAPARLAEISEVLAPEHHHSPNGLFHSKVYTKDTAYSLCIENCAVEELISSLQFLAKSINMFGVDYRWHLVTKKTKIAGSKQLWDRKVQMLAKALNTLGFEYVIDTDEKLYKGPKIEARLVDALEREWPGPNIKVSFFPSKNGADISKTREQPSVLIERSLFGSLERFVAVLVERFAGHFPVWLAPEQVRVIPIKREHLSFAKNILEKLLSDGISATLDSTDHNLAAKIFAVKSAKVPYAVVIGDVEQRNGTIAVCPCEEQGKGKSEDFTEFLANLQSEIKAKSLPFFKQGTKVE